ncbi:MAG: hypothetical protein KGS60_10145 [Verrucomicrobia bacterium]|nr:hypothetical protein [Verrucomicrobiota bacterium]
MNVGPFPVLLLSAVLCLTGAPVAAQTAGPPPHQVTIGMYVNDIQTVDLTTYSYAVDLYLWFRWKDPLIDPVSQFEFMNTFDPEAHVRTVLYEKPVPQPDGSLYQIVRHQGLFSAKFPLHDYPFDRQLLTVTVEDTTMTAPQLVYVPDTAPLTVNNEIRLPGYKIGKATVQIRDKPYPTAFGDLSEPEIEPYSRAEFRIPISRPPVSGLLKTFVPVILIILSAAFALLLDPGHVEARIGLAITALLTLVAMQFTMLSGLPEVAYLTLLDQVYLASYLYILVVIGIVVQGTRVDQTGELRGDVVAVPSSGRRVCFTVTGAYLVLITVIVTLNMLL